MLGLELGVNEREEKEHWGRVGWGAVVMFYLGFKCGCLLCER
jgi:hypothetical protein